MGYGSIVLFLIKQCFVFNQIIGEMWCDLFYNLSYFVRVEMMQTEDLPAYNIQQ